jgi:opacity protein-like surface antigen
MKTTLSKRATFMSLFLATMIAAGYVSSAKAQDLYDDTEDLLQDGGALEMDEIQVDGKLSPSELLRKRREKLEERNKIMVEKKIENIRVKQEIALTNKLNDAFTNGLNNLNEDKVQVTQAAPAPVVAPQPVVQPQPVIQQVIETRVEKVEEPKVEKNSKVIPYLGAQSIKGKNNLDLETKLNIGINLETKVDSNITMGLGLGYTTLSATDVSNVYTNTTSICTTSNCGAREMSYNKLSVEANGKYFISLDSKIKPFVGLGLGFNRTSLKYDDNGSYYYNGVTLGNEGSSSNHFTAAAKLGLEADLTDTIGFNLDLSYAKALTSGFNSESDVASSSNPDQLRLENVSKAMEDADVTAIQAGLVIKF